MGYDSGKIAYKELRLGGGADDATSVNIRYTAHEDGDTVVNVSVMLLVPDSRTEPLRYRFVGSAKKADADEAEKDALSAVLDTAISALQKHVTRLQQFRSEVGGE